jgi:hypothetical protein
MSRHLRISGHEVAEAVRELRRHQGLFSFRDISVASVELPDRLAPELSPRAGSIVEWLVERPGAGAFTTALELMTRSSRGRGAWVVVDPTRQAYIPALTGWGVDLSKTLLLRPSTLQEACWSIEQCLRSCAVSATWAWVDERIPTRVHRRWQLAAEAGGGVGVVFRPVSARRDAVWADLRLLVTPQPGGQGETRRVKIEVLYRRGGEGGSSRVWEIDHATGLVRLVPEVADPAATNRAARA